MSLYRYLSIASRPGFLGFSRSCGDLVDVQSVSSFFPHCALPRVVILSGVEGSLSIRFKHGHAMQFLPPAQSIVETPWQAHDAARGIGIDIDVLSEEMIAARVRIFVGGLRAATSAKSVRVQSGGKVLVTNGHNWRPRSTPAFFWVLEAAD